MKIRLGFISNSSSSLYIIAYKKKVCPTCGYSQPDLLSILESINTYSYDEDSKIRNNKEQLLENIKEEIKVEQESLDSLYKRNPNELTYPDYQYAKDTVADTIIYTKERLEEQQDLLSKIQYYIDQNYEVVDISISYHDNILADMFNSLKENGGIIILDGD